MAERLRPGERNTFLRMILADVALEGAELGLQYGVTVKYMRGQARAFADVMLEQEIPTSDVAYMQGTKEAYDRRNRIVTVPCMFEFPGWKIAGNNDSVYPGKSMIGIVGKQSLFHELWVMENGDVAAVLSSNTLLVYEAANNDIVDTYAFEQSGGALAESSPRAWQTALDAVAKNLAYKKQTGQI